VSPKPPSLGVERGSRESLHRRYQLTIKAVAVRQVTSSSRSKSMRGKGLMAFGAQRVCRSRDSPSQEGFLPSKMLVSFSRRWLPRKAAST
jgi:hypothetical protein